MSAEAARLGWYVARDKQKVGPLTLARMQDMVAAGKLMPTDMVLQAGAQKWMAAGDVADLFPRSIVPAAQTTPSIALTFATEKAGFESRHEILSEAQVVPDPASCVQCGMCSYNCPMEIDVRAHAWRGKPIRDSHCLTCSECVNRCPRGVLRFERIPLFTLK